MSHSVQLPQSVVKSTQDMIPQHEFTQFAFSEFFLKNSENDLLPSLWDTKPVFRQKLEAFKEMAELVGDELIASQALNKEKEEE